MSAIERVAGEGGLRISVIVCTRDRADSCRRTISRLLESRPLGTEMLVVDQSGDESTRTAIEDLERGDEVVYIRSARGGLSAARNEGAAAATGDVLLFTDDDCLPDDDWIEAWRASFVSDVSTGIGFGQVSCPPYDPTKGYTAGFNTRDGSHGSELFKLGAGHVGMGGERAKRPQLKSPGQPGLC